MRGFRLDFDLKQSLRPLNKALYMEASIRLMLVCGEIDVYTCDGSAAVSMSLLVHLDEFINLMLLFQAYEIAQALGRQTEEVKDLGSIPSADQFPFAATFLLASR